MSNPHNPADANAATREYFDSLLLEMRHMDAVLPDTKLELYGETFDTPVMMAALSHLDRVRENGLALMAAGAKAANAVNWAGMVNDRELDAIMQTGARTILIIKPYADHDEIYRRIERAEKLGVLAVGMDLDHAFDGKGRYDVVMGEAMSPKTQKDLQSFIAATKLPFVIKGVLSTVDAQKALDVGAKGIVVSHHHGIMPYAVPPLLVLPEIAAVVQKRIPVFVDCGIASGADVFKALALGADAVSVGRAIFEPLKAEGDEGVRKLIVGMTEELAGIMARTCTPDIRHMDPSVVRKRCW